MGGGKGGGGTDRTEELYRKQQADLARTKQDQEDKDRAARENEYALNRRLQEQMLGAGRNVFESNENEDARIVKNVLG